MNKEIKDRLDKLENELKESKNEIHSLKSSVSLTIERGIRKLLSRFTRKQLILGFVITLFSISMIGIAGTVTKTYTFSSGEVVSASKFNTNFDTLFTLVNGNLDDSNISSVSGSKITSGTVAAARIDSLDGSKITSGTVAAARIDSLDGSKITSGTVAAARIDNLDGSKITSGTIAAARIGNLDGSKITSGVFNNSIIPKNADSIVLFATPRLYDGNLEGRSGADAKCLSHLDNESISMFNNSCSNVTSLISVDSSDEIRDMVSNYGIPTNRKIRGRNGMYLGGGWDNITGGIGGTYYLDYGLRAGLPELFQESGDYHNYWTGSNTDASVNSNSCNGWTSNSSSVSGGVGNPQYQPYNTSTGRTIIYNAVKACNIKFRLLCACY